MAERLVDVLNNRGQVIHTYPITLDDEPNGSSDSDYIARALEAAAHGRLVPDDELGKLTARIHVSHGGALQPFGDEISSTSETILGLEQAVRVRAYLLWEQEGRHEGRADEYWARALDEHIRERAYAYWQQEGSPEGGADQNWHRLRDFQAR